MKNHDIHENKNVCPEFNGEKMHEQKNGLQAPEEPCVFGRFLTNISAEKRRPQRIFN
jgi:hypothetical protein